MRRRICACTYCAGEPWSVDVSPFSLTALLSAALGPSSLIRKQSFPSVRLHSNHERRGADGRRRFDFRPLGGQVFFFSYSCVIYIEKKERERERERRKGESRLENPLGSSLASDEMEKIDLRGKEVVRTHSSSSSSYRPPTSQ